MAACCGFAQLSALPWPNPPAICPAPSLYCFGTIRTWENPLSQLPGLHDGTEPAWWIPAISIQYAAILKRCCFSLQYNTSIFYFIWLRHTLLACFLASFPLLFVLSSGFPHTDFLEYLFYLAIDTLRSGGNVYAALDAVCIGRRWAGSITYCTVYFFLEAVSRMLL